MQQYKEQSDWELAARLKLGDRAAYAEIYNRYWALLFRYARRLLQNEEEAGNVVQDVFVMLWSKSTELEIKASLSSLLYASARNRILKHFQRSKVRANYLLSLEKFMDEGVPVTDLMVLERELSARIEQEVALLPPKMREIFELSRKANLSYKEIAEKLGISENTVKKQINNALKTLRQKLGPLFFLALFL